MTRGRELEAGRFQVPARNGASFRAGTWNLEPSSPSVGASKKKPSSTDFIAEQKKLVARAIGETFPPPSSPRAERLAAAALLELARARHHLRRASGHLPAVKPGKKTKIEGSAMHHTDLPAELVAYSDGLSDDASFHPEIIGACDCSVSGLGDLTVGSGLSQYAVGAGLSDLAVGAGIPNYLLTRKGLHDRTVRARVAQNIRAMTPKLRRRVLHRLRQAVTAARGLARVSGEVRSAYPSIAGWGQVAGSFGGHIAVGRCPYANVAGALTP